MNNREIVLAALESTGKADALDLRARAPEMDGTAIIREEQKAPAWERKDYTGWPAGSPVQDGGQVYKLIQPHDATAYEGRPETLRALWSLCHTKDADRAKAWVAPLGTSGMYMEGECYKAEDGTVWRAKQDKLIYDAEALPSAWEEVI